MANRVWEDGLATSAEAAVDPNFPAKELVYNALFMGQQNRLRQAVAAMSARAAAGVDWAAIDCMPNHRGMHPEDRPIILALANALKAYAISLEEEE